MYTKKINKLVTIIICIISILCFSNCEIGLGDSVDTQPPTVEISYPPVDSVIRDSFVMSGAAADETSLDKVEIKFESVEKDKSGYGPFNATISGTTWTISLNTNAGDGTWSIADGSYKVTATATDSAGRYTTTNTVYTIDNTPPVLAVSTPSSKGSGTPYAFGSELNIEGLQYDENQGQKFKFEFYKKNSDGSMSSVGGPYYKENSLSNWTLDFTTEEAGFQALVNAMDNSESTETFWYIISVCDSAQSFTNPSESSNTSDGNWSQYYYSWTDITDLVKPGESVPKINALYRLDKNNLSASDVVPVDLTYAKLAELRLNSSGLQTYNTGCFSIDPSGIYPVIDIDGWKASYSYAENQIGQGSTIRVEVSKGKNLNTTITRETMKAKLTKEDGTLLYTDSSKGDVDGWRPITDYSGTSPVKINWPLTETTTAGNYKLEFDVENNKTNKATNNIFKFFLNLGAPRVDSISPSNGSTGTVFVTDKGDGTADFNSMEIIGYDDGSIVTLTIRKNSDSGEVITVLEEPTSKELQVSGEYKYIWKTPNTNITIAKENGKFPDLVLWFGLKDAGNYSNSAIRTFKFKETQQIVKELEQPSGWANGSGFDNNDIWLSTGTTLSIKGSAGYNDATENINPTSDALLSAVDFYVTTQVLTKEQVEVISDGWKSGQVNGSSQNKGPSANETWSPFTATIAEDSSGNAIAENGAYYVWIRLTDGATLATNSKGTPQELGKFTVDTVRPDTSIALKTEDIKYTDAISGLKYTTNPDFTVSGRCADYHLDTVKLKIDSNDPIEITPSGEAGAQTWTYTVNDLAEALHTIKLIACDKTGSTVESVISIQVDKTSPILAITTPSGLVDCTSENSPKMVSEKDFKIKGNVSDLSNLKLYDGFSGGKILYTTDGSNWNVITDSDTGFWELSRSVDEDENIRKIRFKVQDVLGQETVMPSESGYYYFGYSSSNPGMKITKIGSVENSNGITIEGNGAPEYWVEKENFALEGLVGDNNGIKWLGYTLSETETESSYTKYQTGTPLATKTWTKVESMNGSEPIGSWSFTVPVSSTSSNKIKVWVYGIDKFANPTIIKIPMLFDTQAPSITVKNLEVNGKTQITTLPYTISGTWSDNAGSGISHITVNNSSSTSAKLEYSLDNGTTWSEVTYTGTASAREQDWSCIISSSQEQNTDLPIWFRATDAVGNTTSISSYQKFSAIIDTEQPVINITTSDVTYLKNGDTYTFSGKATDTLKLDTVTITVRKDGTEQPSYSVERTKSNQGELSEADWDNLAINSTENVWKAPVLTSSTGTAGLWTFTATAKDKAGRTTASETRTIRVDPTSPVPAVKAGGMPDKAADSTTPYTFRGTASDGVESWSSGVSSVSVSISDDSSHTDAVTAGGTTDWSAVFNMGTGSLETSNTVEGVYNLYAKATDIAGNISDWIKISGNDGFVYDTARPVLTETTGTDSASAVFSLSGAVTDNYGRAAQASGGAASTDGLYVTQQRGDGAVVAISGTGLGWTGTEKNGVWTLSGLPRNPENVSESKVQDGEFKYVIIAHDKAGKESTPITRTVVIDLNAPAENTITVPQTNLAGQDASTAFKGKTTYTFSGFAKDYDGGRGIGEIWYAFTQEATAPNRGTSSTDGYTKYTQGGGTLTGASSGDTWSVTKDLVSGLSLENNKLNEGIWYLHVKAQDKAGNITIGDGGTGLAAVATRKFEVDLANPEMSNVKEKSGSTENAMHESGVAYKTSLFDILLTGTDTYNVKSIVITQSKDSGTDLVVLKKENLTGTSISASTAPASEPDGYIGSLPRKTTNPVDGVYTTAAATDGSDDGSYSYTITVTDNVGNTVQRSASFQYDTKGPEVAISSVSPSVSTETAGSYKVNGRIMLKGTAFDNDKLSTLSYTYNSGSPVSITDNMNNWTIANLDTTQASDNQKLGDLLTFAATDRAGNSMPSSVGTTIKTYLNNYTIDQNSDKPVATPSNILTEPDSVNAVGYVNNEAVNVFGLNSNNKLISSLEDDDGVSKVWVKIVGSSDSAPEFTTGYYEFSNTPMTVQYNYTIPSDTSYGFHRVYIKVTDKNWTNDTDTPNNYMVGGPFYIAIDNGGPELVISEPTAEFVSTTFNLSGTMRDNAGVSTVTITDGTSPTSATPSWNSGEETAHRSGTWSGSYTVPDGTNEGTLTVTATNTIRNTTSKTVSYKVDRGNPVITLPSGYQSGDIKIIDASSPTLRVSGTASDPSSGVLASGLAQLRYQIKYAKWDTATSKWIFDTENNGEGAEEPSSSNFTQTSGISAIGTETWSANIDFSSYVSDQNVLLIYFAAFDNAGNSSVVKSLAVKIDKEKPLIPLINATVPTAITLNSKNYYKANFTLSGTASDSVALASVTAMIRGSSITLVNGGSSTGGAGETVNWSFAIPVKEAAYSGGSYLTSDGSYDVIITATDGCGQTKQETYTFTRDTTAPTATFSNIDSTGTYASPATSFTQALPEILGTYSDTTSGIKSIKYIFRKYATSSTWNDVKIWDTETTQWNATDGETYIVTSGNTSGALKLPMDKFLGIITSTDENKGITDGIWQVVVVAEDYVGNTTPAVGATGAIQSAAFRVDRHIPTLTMTAPAQNKIVQKGDGITVSGTTSDVCGGEISKVDIKIVHDSTSITKAETTILPAAFTGDTWTWTLAEADSPFDADNDYTITVKVTDKGGNTRELERSVSCDNTPPAMSFKRPFTMTVATTGTHSATNQTNRIIGDLTVEGSVTDFAMDSIYYQIGGAPVVTKNGDGVITQISITGGAITENVVTPVETTILGSWVKSSDNYNWSFQANTMQYKSYATKVTANDDNDTNLKTLYIYVASVDQAGNLNFATFPIKIDTDGDKPVSVISAPEADQTDNDGSYAKVGGSFVVSGGATDDNYVHSVYMQVKVVGGNYVEDGTSGISVLTGRTGTAVAGQEWGGSTATDGKTAADVLAGSGTTATYFKKISAHGSALDNANNETDNSAWYKVENTTAWRYTLNKNREFFLENIKNYLATDPGSSTDPIVLIIYIKTLDTKTNGTISSGDGKYSRFGEVVQLRIKVDSDVPGIELTEFPAANSYVTSTADVEFRLTDDSGLDSFELTANDTVIASATKDDSSGIPNGWTFTQTSVKDWTVSGTITDFHKNALNKSALKIKVLDNSNPNKESYVERTVIVDNTAPLAEIPTGVETGKSYKLKADTADGSSDRETDTRGAQLRLWTTTATINGKTSDETNGSGIRAALLYFTKTSGSTTTMYNLSTGATSDISSNQLTMQKDGEGTTTVAFPVASIESLQTKKINGVASAYVMIDTAEGGNDSSYNADGDGYAENLKADGTWFVILDTTKLSDGAYDVNYVTIDNSGNARYYKDTALVQNNAPSLSSIILATDITGDGTINTEISESNSEAKQYVISTSTTTTTFESRNEKLKVISVVKGKNAPLKVSLKYPSSTSEVQPLSITTGNKATVTNAVYDSTAETYTCTFDITDFKTDSTSSTDYRDFVVEVTDSISPVLTGGEKTIRLLYNNVDKIAPNAELIAFNNTEKAAINSTTGNYDASLTAALAVSAGSSIFKFNGTENDDKTKNMVSGHVEPRNALPSGSNLPTLSGTVIIRGKATDNQRIAAIKLLLNATDEASAITIIEWDSTNMKLKASSGYESKVAIINETLNQDGHSVEWAYAWDTSAVASGTGVGSALPIRVIAQDSSTINIEGGLVGPLKSSKVDYTNENTAYNAETVDLVPYITGVKTSLWTKNRQNPTVFTRSALGKYAVRENESVIINGFNFGAAPVVELDGTSLTTSNIANTTSPVHSTVTVDIGTTAGTGYLALKNGVVSSLNNTNSNTQTANQMPNGANNNLLTDDVEFDVWQFKNIATPAVSALKSPNLKVSPKDGKIGASFSNFMFFNMAGLYNDGTYYTQTPFMLGYNGCDDNTFAFDKNGYTYGAIQYQTNNSQAQSGFFHLFLGRAINVGSMKAGDGYFCNSGGTRLEANAVNLLKNPVKASSTTTYQWLTNLYRITSPSIVAVANSTSSEVIIHIAYADTTTKQIRYRQGKVNANAFASAAVTDTTGQAAYNMTDSSLRDVFDFDSTYASSTGSYSSSYKTSQRSTGGYNYNANAYVYPYIDGVKCSGMNNSRDICPPDSLQTLSGQKINVIASSGASLSSGEIADIYKKTSDAHNYANGAGEFCALGVENDEQNKGNVLVAWQDSDTNELKIAYNTATQLADAGVNGANSGSRTAEWEETTKTVGTGGAYVQMVVDSDNGIHLAYYDDTDGDLKYAYKASSDTWGAAWNISLIDSYADVGSNCSLNVAKDTDGNQVPYIGYYSNKMAKQAVRIKFGSGTGNGADSDTSMYTGNWEITYVPTETTIIEDKVNVAVWTQTDGTLGVIPAATTGDLDKTTSNTNGDSTPGNSTYVHGNGTANPVVGYITKDGVFDMAQKK